MFNFRSSPMEFRFEESEENISKKPKLTRFKCAADLPDINLEDLPTSLADAPPKEPKIWSPGSRKLRGRIGATPWKDSVHLSGKKETPSKSGHHAEEEDLEELLLKEMYRPISANLQVPSTSGYKLYNPLKCGVLTSIAVQETALESLTPFSILSSSVDKHTLFHLYMKAADCSTEDQLESCKLLLKRILAFHNDLSLTKSMIYMIFLNLGFVEVSSLPIKDSFPTILSLASSISAKRPPKEGFVPKLELVLEGLLTQLMTFKDEDLYELLLFLLCIGIDQTVMEECNYQLQLLRCVDHIIELLPLSKDEELAFAIYKLAKGNTAAIVKIAHMFGYRRRAVQFRRCLLFIFLQDIYGIDPIFATPAQFEHVADALAVVECGKVPDSSLRLFVYLLEWLLSLKWPSCPATLDATLSSIDAILRNPSNNFDHDKMTTLFFKLLAKPNATQMTRQVLRTITQNTL